MRKLLMLGALCALGASAETFSVGLIGGAPFTDVTNSVNQNNLSLVPKSTNFIVGPALQVDLPLGLRLEGDALYRPASFSVTSTAVAGVSVPTSYTVSGNQWSFPILVAYRFNLPAPLIKPFVEAGVAYDHLANVSAAAKTITSGPGTLLRQTNAGFILGGGVDVKVPFIRLSGELRYTHQASADFQGLSNLNQAEVLVGVHF